MPGKKQILNKKIINLPLKKRVFGYIRVSTEQQKDDGSSLPAQQARIEAYCKYNNLQLTEPKFFIDDKSGKNIENRPSLKNLLSDLQAGDIYIFPSVSRLGRSLIDNFYILEQFTEVGCKLIILDSNIDTTNHYGEMFFGMMSLMAQGERKLLSARVKEVMKYMKKQGTLITKPPFGYQISKIDNKSCIIENPAEQTVIKFIVQLVENKPFLKLCQIIKILEENNITLRNGKLYHTGITLILNKKGLKYDKICKMWVKID